MKVFDCFMFFDEDIILDIRLNELNEYVDYFVIVESRYNHNGQEKKLNFDLDNFRKFKDKIIYIVHENIPKEIKKINDFDSDHEKDTKYIFNAAFRENDQRNHISKGLINADENDMILISDVDEIPNLKDIKFKEIKEKLIFFKQEMFYYKFNLKLPNLNWVGTKSCKMKYLQSPQWIRNIKDRKYPFYRFDTIFSKTKYSNIKFLEEGGWHFTNIKTAEKIKYKLKSYLHHREFEVKPITVKEIDQLINDKKAIYDLNLDKRDQKIGHGKNLEKYDINSLPKYIRDNLDKYKDWID